MPKRAEQLSGEERLERHIDLCRRSFVAFAAYVCHWKLYPFQIQVCEFLQDLSNTPDGVGVLVMPRRHAKTTLAMAWLAWLLGRGRCFDEDGQPLGFVERVIYASATSDMAGRKAAGLRDLFADRADGIRSRARIIFPECELAPNMAAGAAWKFRGASSSDPTCLGLGVGSQLSGFGYHVLCPDDLIKDAEEAQSDLIRRKTADWLFQVAQPAALSPALELDIGTRWHSEDTIGLMFKGDTNHEIKVLHFPGVLDEGTPGERALCPEIRSLKRHFWVRERSGERAFQCQVQGNPTPEGGLVWKRAWFDGDPKNGVPTRRCKRADLPDPREMVSMATFWDTAEGQTSAHDSIGYCRAGRDRTGHIWIYTSGSYQDTMEGLKKRFADGFGGDWNEEGLVEGGRSSLWFQQGVKDCGRPVKLISAVKLSKAERARAVSNLAETGMVHIPDDGPGEALVAALCRFAGAKKEKNDEADAFSGVLAGLSQRSQPAIGHGGSRRRAEEGVPDSAARRRRKPEFPEESSDLYAKAFGLLGAPA